MRRCRVCGAEIGVHARECPRCGAPGPNPKAEPSAFLLIAGGAGVCAVALVVVAGMMSHTAPVTVVGNCEADWTKCGDNAQLMNTPAIADDMRSKCREAADSQANYRAPLWPPNAFASFRQGKDYVESGIITAIETHAQFEDRTGRVVTPSIACRYDLFTKTVLTIDFAKR
jgi:hypothetical protein